MVLEWTLPWVLEVEAKRKKDGGKSKIVLLSNFHHHPFISNSTFSVRKRWQSLPSFILSLKNWKLRNDFFRNLGHFLHGTIITIQTCSDFTSTIVATIQIILGKFDHFISNLFDRNYWSVLWGNTSYILRNVHHKLFPFVQNRVALLSKKGHLHIIESRPIFDHLDLQISIMHLILLLFFHSILSALALRME